MIEVSFSERARRHLAVVESRIDRLELAADELALAGRDSSDIERMLVDAQRQIVMRRGQLHALATR